MTSSHRPYGYLRHTAQLASPAVAAAGMVALERDASVRLRRLADAAADRVRQRLRPTRRRMRALAAGPRGRLDWRDVPVPVLPGPLGALVRPIAVATCDLDRPLAMGATPFPLPLHLGHECVAEVVDVGDQVTGVRPGALVVVPFEISCGRCGPCRSGRSANCAAVPPISMYGFGLAGGHWGGAYSDLLAVPFADGMLVPLPNRIDPVAAASVADTICDGYRHIAPHLPDLLAEDPGAEVVIVSAQDRRSLFSASCPLYAGQTALALGGETVWFADARAGVRAKAEQLGLRPLTPAELRRRPLAPLVVDLSATAKGLRTALSITAPDGICSSAGGLHRVARIPAGLMYGRNVTLHIGRAHTRTIIPAVLDLMLDGLLHPEKVVTTVAPLDEAPRALREHMHGDSIKTILTA